MKVHSEKRVSSTRLSVKKTNGIVKKEQSTKKCHTENIRKICLSIK